MSLVEQHVRRRDEMTALWAFSQLAVHTVVVGASRGCLVFQRYTALVVVASFVVDRRSSIVDDDHES